MTSSLSFFARHGFKIVLITVFFMPFMLIGSIRALRSNRNDVKDWLPEDFPETAVHTWFQQHFPHEQFVLASWEGCTLDDPRLELLAVKLETYDPDLEDLELRRRHTKVLRSHGLTTRRAIEQFGDLGRLEELSQADANEIQRRIDAWRSPFKLPVLTGRRLLDELQQRYPDLSREDILERLEGTLIGMDHYKTCLVVTLNTAAKGKRLHPTLKIIHKLAQQCDIEPVPPVDDRSIFLRIADGVIGFVAELVYGREPPPEGLHLGGPPVDNVAIDNEGQRTLFRLAGLSAVVGLGISWFCFRSVRLTFMVFFTALLAAGTGLAMVYFTGSYSDAVLLSMPSLVYVLAISGAIHIVNYYHDAIRENGLTGAPERALRHGFLPCFLAALTTALGLGSLVISDVVPISKFGTYSASGVMTTLLLIFLFLPAVLYFFPSRAYAERIRHEGEEQVGDTLTIRAWRRVGGLIIGHNYLVAGACLVVMVVCAFGLPRLRTSIQLAKLFSADAPILADYRWLEDNLGPLVPMEVVLRVDNQRCGLSFVDRMRLAEHIQHMLKEKLDDVGGALSAATFASDIAPETREPTTVERIAGIDPRRMRDRILNERLQEHIDQFVELGYLATDKDIAVADEKADPSLEELGLYGPPAEQLAVHGLDSLKDIEAAGDLSALEGISAEQAAQVASAVRNWKHNHRNPTLEELGLEAGIAEALRQRELTTLLALERYGDPEKPLDERLAAIPGLDPAEAAAVAQAIDTWRTDHGQQLWRITARVQALGDLDYGLFVHDLQEVVEPVLAQCRAANIEGVHATYTGLVPLVYRTQHALMENLFESLVMAFGLIAVVMMAVLKSPRSGLLSMIPNLFPVVVIFGIMGWINLLVDIGTMMTASVALGVAVDDTIHYLTWFRDGLDKGWDRKRSALWAYERCATAMTQTTLIGGFGLSVFAFSSFTPTQRFGVLMLTLLAVALVGDLIFLPAILTGPVGGLFRGSRKRRPAPSAPPQTEPQPAPAPEQPAPLDQEPLTVPIGASAAQHESGQRSARQSHKAS